MFGDPVLDLRNLSKNYGAMRALDNVSFKVYRGEVFGYVGANGAGKTTTIKILAGLMRPNTGDAFIRGISIVGSPVQAKMKIGYVPESGALFEKLSPREYLTALGHLYRMPEKQIRQNVEAWLAFFGLADRIDQPIGILSKGNKQKICWIAATLHHPEILILDEPLNGLDVESIAHIKEFMTQFTASGGTIFYSSHLMDIVEKVCTRIAVLHRGKLVGVGSIEIMRMMFDAPSLEQALLKLNDEPMTN